MVLTGMKEILLNAGIVFLGRILRVYSLKRILQSFLILDILMTNDEDRYIAIGVSSLGKYMFIAFTLRSKNDKVLIRPNKNV